MPCGKIAVKAIATFPSPIHGAVERVILASATRSNNGETMSLIGIQGLLLPRSGHSILDSW